MLYGVKVNITGQCMADAFVGVMPDVLTHCAHCLPLTPGLKQFYTRSVTVELAEEYLKSFKKYIKKIKITLSLRCLTLSVPIENVRQVYVITREQTPCVASSQFTSSSFTNFKTLSFFTSWSFKCLRLQLISVSWLFYYHCFISSTFVHCEIWNL